VDPREVEAYRERLKAKQDKSLVSQSLLPSSPAAPVSAAAAAARGSDE